MNKSTTRITVKILLFLAIIAFVFPFMTVSCSVGTDPANASGFEMAIGRFANDALDTSQSAKPNLLVLASLLLTVGALAIALLTYLKKKPLPRIAVGMLAILAALLLIAASLTVTDYYDLTEEHLQIVTFQTRYGLYLTVLLQLASGILSFFVPVPKDTAEEEIEQAIEQALNHTEDT